MVRSIWIGSLAAALSCAAPGWGQTLRPDHTFMVREGGKPAVKCRVVSCWTLKDGSTMAQARTEAGEMLTLLEEPGAGAAGAPRMRILPETPSGEQAAPRLTPVPQPTVRPAVGQVKGDKPATLLGQLFGRSGTTATASPPLVTEPPSGQEASPGLFARLRAPLGRKPIEPRPNLMPGMGSVMAANDPGLRGEPGGAVLVQNPDGTTALMQGNDIPPGAVVVAAEPNNAFVQPGPRGPVRRQAPALVFDVGAPDGAPNAFTLQTTPRPIPADFGPPPRVPNAFRPDGQGAGMATVYYPGMMPGPAGGPAMFPTGPVVAQLRGSLMPSEREEAADALAVVDWRADPQVVAALVMAAQSDPAATVRVSCVRALGRMKVWTEPVIDTLQTLKGDRDARVRQEAEQTLARMSAH